ncbi:MAG: amidohydrolase [Candidatus Eremiobacteraeota bacterium]|nr:amidohydrolase [Candidatus Eremiobacteraeota bacterium]
MQLAEPIPEAVRDEVIATRRHIHMHPELGFEETGTAELIEGRLKRLGYEVHAGIATTGVVGVMRGAKPGRTIMLRADMDALPLSEHNHHAYRSQNDGKMHACGHDGHVAILLGAATLIANRKEELAGTVCLVFQPAEEGKGGAQKMVEEGMLERFGIERAYGLHLSSKYPVGTLGFREGPFYASSDSIEIDINGGGGHGAAPHETVDPILSAANFVTSVQQVVSRVIDPTEPAVITIGSIHGGTTHNVIPGNLRMLGTVRAFASDVRDAMPERIERVLKSCCDLGRTSYTFDYLWRYPVTVNDVAQTEYTRNLARSIVAEQRVIESAKLMGAEDFSFFAQRVPSTFYTLGAQGGTATANPHHSSTFDIDERALETGVQMMTALAFDAPRNAP